MLGKRPLWPAAASVLAIGMAVTLVVADATADDAPAPLKRAIAVVDFEDRTDDSSWSWGGPHPGEGLADMLTTALVQAGEFRVIERQQLKHVLGEQELGERGITTPESAAEIGRVLGVSAIVYGAVTEFGYKKEESGGVIGKLSGGAGYKKQEARVACDVRLVDTTTGEIIAAESYSKGDSKRGLSVSHKDFAFGHDSKLDQTLVGKASRKVVDEIVQRITDATGGLAWTGRIVKADSDTRIFLNAGSTGGVTTGMQFQVLRPGEELIDPATGLNLGSEETLVGTIEVVDVKDKYSICKAVSGSDFAGGDIVRAP